MKEAIFAEVRCIVLYAVRTPIPTTLSRIYLVLHFHILSFRAAPLRYPFGAIALEGGVGGRPSDSMKDVVICDKSTCFGTYMQWTLSTSCSSTTKFTHLAKILPLTKPSIADARTQPFEHNPRSDIKEATRTDKRGALICTHLRGLYSVDISCQDYAQLSVNHPCGSRSSSSSAAILRFMDF